MTVTRFQLQIVVPDIRSAAARWLEGRSQFLLRSISVAVGNQIDSIVPLEAKIDHAVKKTLI